MFRASRALCLLVTLIVAGATIVLAADPPIRSASFAPVEYKSDSVDFEAQRIAVGELPTALAGATRERLERLGANAASAQIDARSGRFDTLLPSLPLVPGDGVGNSLTWGDKEPATRSDREAAAWAAFHGYLQQHAEDLAISVDELGSGYRVVSHDGDLYQIWAPREIHGYPVRDSFISAVINRGNLILMSVARWGDADARAPQPVPVSAARQSVAAHLTPLVAGSDWNKPELLYVPSVDPAQPDSAYDYRLVWAVRHRIVGDEGGSWETLVDAETGEVLAVSDTNQYADVKGGVFPVSNDGNGADGTEQAGWPMPFMNVNGMVTDTGGNVATAGNLTGTLVGPYVQINDNCGAISLTQANGLDFGTSGGTDCTTPGFGGAGNTHASRTGFYELNKIIEMGRGQLPANVWLTQQLTANMNINQTCNAFWNGTVNFYRSGGGCFNTGEIAGVFDHEWGHGLDANDVNPGIAGPSGEGIADIYTALRLNNSCIGRGFRATPCTGFGDPCLTCTGVRDIDYLQRQSGLPHTYTWSNANCGGSVHCVGSVYAEAVWSLWKRNLQAAPYNYDNNTAHEIVTRMTYIGAGAVGTWFSGGPPNGGCGGTGGYLNYLAADDDNGDLNDGTPHMQAIYDAFNDQEIACATPTVQDAGCAAVPTAAPTVTPSAGNQEITLNWTGVANATGYQVFRTEGVHACDFGKVKLGETATTTWTDTGLQNGRDYSYVVLPVSGPSCLGPASSCTTESPVGEPDFLVGCTPSSLLIEEGTSDDIVCTVVSQYGYTGTVDLTCDGTPSEIGCSFSPSQVVLAADASEPSTLTISVDPGTPVASYGFDVNGNDGVDDRTSPVTVQVTPAGQNGPQDAIYDGGMGAPMCATAGTQCDSLSLVDGRGSLGPEPNEPNTLDACTDGGSGTYHNDESNDRLVVRTLDYYDFAPGATVEIEATVWAWSTGSSDSLDLYYAADANNPVWTFIDTLVPPGGGAQTLTAQYVLPEGSLQAVRANFRYQGSASSCSGGNYDDADDLVFAVSAGSIFADGFESGDTTAW